MCWSNNSKTLSWLGILWGLLSLSILLTAFLSNVWLYTKEPIWLSNNDILTTVTFKIGLWRICPSFKRSNATFYVPNGPCTSIKYSSWQEITPTDIGITGPLEFTPSFLSKMRISTPFGAVSVVLIFLATLFALAGVYYNDHKTMVACGLYILGGITLGGGLLVFASVLSDAYFERPRRPHIVTHAHGKIATSGLFDYKYGWSFFAASAAFFMSELAAILSILAYLRRFPSVEEMVRVMVPGAERRLKDRHSLAGEYLVQHQTKCQKQDPEKPISLTSGIRSKSKGESVSKYDVEGMEKAMFLNKPAPDICSSNPGTVTENIINFGNSPSASSGIFASDGGLYCMQPETLYIHSEIDAFPSNSDISSSSLAGQTVPILLMNQSQKFSKPRFLFKPPSTDVQKNFKMSTLPLADVKKTAFSTQTSIQEEAERSFFASEFSDFEAQVKSQNPGFGFRHLKSDTDPSGNSFFETFHSEEPLIQTGMIGQVLDVPGASSTTSSSSGAGSGTTVTTGSSHSSLSKKSGTGLKKKTVTIGNVFSRMDTFESERTEGENFEFKIGV